MDDVLSVAMVDSLEELFHVTSRYSFIESLVLLLSDAIKQRLASYVLHHQVDVLQVVVRLVVLDDVGVVKRVKDGDFFHDAVDVIHKLILVQNLDGDLEVRVMLVIR